MSKSMKNELAVIKNDLHALSAEVIDLHKQEVNTPLSLPIALRFLGHRLTECYTAIATEEDTDKETPQSIG